MLSQHVQNALDGLLNAQLYSGYVYFGASLFFRSCNLPGLASYVMGRCNEELRHARDITDYLHQRQGRITLQHLDAPTVHFGNIQSAVMELRRHEQRMGGLINDLLNLAIGEKDHATVAFLQPLLSCQVKEESDICELCTRLTAVCEGQGGVHVLDHELSHHCGRTTGNPTID